MTILMSAREALARLDWIHASWLVGDALPLNSLFQFVIGAVTRICEIPIIGSGLAYAFIPLLTVVVVVAALSSAALVILVLLVSALLSGAIETILGGTAQLFDAVERLCRLVHGA